MKKIIKYSSRALCLSLISGTVLLALLSLLRLMASGSSVALRIFAVVLFLLLCVLVVLGAASFALELIRRCRYARKYSAHCGRSCIVCPHFRICSDIGFEDEESSARTDAAQG